jgi:hypothetical protein
MNTMGLAEGALFEYLAEGSLNDLEPTPKAGWVGKR